MIKDIYKKYPSTKYLYRGSIYYKKRLYPRHYKNDIKVIFSTSNLDLAISYIRKPDSMIAQCDNKEVCLYEQCDNKEVCLYELRKNEFTDKLTSSGYLYILDKTKFKKSTFLNLHTEYISDKIQKPVCIIFIKNPLKILQNSKNIKLIKYK